MQLRSQSMAFEYRVYDTVTSSWGRGVSSPGAYGRHFSSGEGPALNDRQVILS